MAFLSKEIARGPIESAIAEVQALIDERSAGLGVKRVLVLQDPAVEEAKAAATKAEISRLAGLLAATEGERDSLRQALTEAINRAISVPEVSLPQPQVTVLAISENGMSRLGSPAEVAKLLELVKDRSQSAAAPASASAGAKPATLNGAGART